MTALFPGDCRDVLKTLPDASVDSVVTDPPYGLGFMGKAWDSFAAADVPMRRNPEMDAVNAGASRQGGRQRACADYQLRQARDMRTFQGWCEEWARECLRVLKPGGHLVSFGGTRTYHRLTCGIEDAGFEIRDCLAWMYGSGFPKSLNLPGGFGTALKPAFEPIVLARKPLAGTVAANVLEHGTGALNIDGCRIGHASPEDAAAAFPGGRTTSHGSGSLAGPGAAQDAERSEFEATRSPLGRWPANVVLDEEAGAMLDAETGDAPSRFFYCAKTSTAEREDGCDALPPRQLDDSRDEDAPGGNNPRNRGAGERRNHHPTVKPIDLMRWLVRLVTPPGGTVLDPFAGSGTTPCACIYEDLDCIGIEREPDFVTIAEARIARAVALHADATRQQGLFG